jgi:hypothetical protein
MPSIRERSVGPPKRLIVRIAIAIGFVTAIYLYAAHMTQRDKVREESAGHILSLLLEKGNARQALAEAVSAERNYGNSSTLARAMWAAVMAGGGKHGRVALLRRTFAFTPHDPRFSLMFSRDSRFLAAMDGNSITVWNVENGTHVLTAEAGDRFVGYWRIEAHHFGLLASYQYYDLVNDVIALPDGFRYAQPAKDSLTGVAPGGDWAYRVPDSAAGRTDYPIKLIDLHTSEKREVDAGYFGTGPVAVNGDGTRIANLARAADMVGAQITDARQRHAASGILGMASQLYFSKALNALISTYEPNTGPNAGRDLNLSDADNGTRLLSLSVPDGGTRAVADDLNGQWFAVQSGDIVRIYRGVNSPLLSAIAEKEVSPAPATSH